MCRINSDSFYFVNKAVVIIYIYVQCNLNKLVRLSHSVPDPHPVSCCFDFFTGKIPRPNILNVKKTDAQCEQQGFMWVSKNTLDIKHIYYWFIMR